MEVHCCARQGKACPVRDCLPQLLRDHHQDDRMVRRSHETHRNPESATHTNHVMPLHQARSTESKLRAALPAMCKGGGGRRGNTVHARDRRGQRWCRFLGAEERHAQVGAVCVRVCVCREEGGERNTGGREKRVPHHWPA